MAVVKVAFLVRNLCYILIWLRLVRSRSSWSLLEDLIQMYTRSRSYQAFERKGVAVNQGSQSDFRTQQITVLNTTSLTSPSVYSSLAGISQGKICIVDNTAVIVR